MEDNNSPDMVKFSEVVEVISRNNDCFVKTQYKDGMAVVLRSLSSLGKYDLHPVSDNITNNNTTVNVIAEDKKIKALLGTIAKEYRK